MKEKHEGSTPTAEMRENVSEPAEQAQNWGSVGQMAGGVAHDFNNILAAMMMHLNLLDQNPRLDQRTHKSLKQMMVLATRAANLTGQLPRFSRPFHPKAKVLDLNELVTNLARMLGRLMGEHISLRLNSQGDLPAVEADPGMLEQVLLNLALNARDAMPQGGSLTISLDSFQGEAGATGGNIQAQSGQFVRVSLTDTGCGMDKAALKGLFEPLFTNKEVVKGAGIGLASVERIIAQHKGWVEVDSQLGRGTTFRIFLPVARGNHDRVAWDAANGGDPMPRNYLQEFRESRAAAS